MMVVGIHHIVEAATADGCFSGGSLHHFKIKIIERTALSRQIALQILAILVPSEQGGDVPIIKNGGATVASAESFLFHTPFAQLLTEIYHKRIGVHAGRYQKCGLATMPVAGIEV